MASDRYQAPVSGLWTAPNSFTAAPAGSLSQADDVIFEADELLRPRYGFPLLGGTFGSSTSRGRAIVDYDGGLLLHYDTTKLAFATAAGNNFSDFSGSFTAPDSFRMPFVKGARNVYFGTTEGIYVLSSASGTPARAGNAQPLSLDITGMASSTGAWMPARDAVAYRFTICQLDAYNRVVEGPPSGRLIVENLIRIAIGNLNRAANVCTLAMSGVKLHWLDVGDVVTLAPGEANFAAGNETIATTPNNSTATYADVGANAANTVVQYFDIVRFPTLKLYFQPATLTTRHFLRLYRSEGVSAETQTPDDNLYLAFETGFLTSGQISNGYIEVNDTTPESQLAVPLHTNSAAGGGEGATQANYRPPLARHAASFQSRALYLNTERLHSIELQLLGTGAPDGLQDGDTITIDGQAFVAELTPAVATDFQLATTLTPEENIRYTALALIERINNYAGTQNVWARYVSTETGAPGRILIESRTFADGSFVLISSRATCWQPQLPSSGSTVASDNDRHPGRLHWSKVDQPEAVPIANNAPVGDDNAAGLAVATINYRAIVFKEDGIFAVSGEAPFTITKIGEARLLAPDSVAALGDHLLAFTSDGVLRIGDGGIENVSPAIDIDLRALVGVGSQISTFAAAAFGVAYPLGRQYLLWLPDALGSSSTPGAWVFSSLNGGWTRYRFGGAGAVVDPVKGRLLVLRDDSNALRYEGRGTAWAAYDLDYTVSLLAASYPGDETTILQTADASAVLVGDVAVDSNAVELLVLSVSENQVTLLGIGDFAGLPASFTFRHAVPSAFTLNPITGGSPATEKVWQQATLLFRRNEAPRLTVGFSTEVAPAAQEVALEQTSWGDAPFGDEPWGGLVRKLLRVEPLPSQSGQACQLSITVEAAKAGAVWEFQGVAVDAPVGSDVNQG